jgi:uncharacterized protein YndB with AHSA1/START domain
LTASSPVTRLTPPSPRLVCLPADDSDFAACAHELLETVGVELPRNDGHAEFERRLQRLYPGATVRRREPMAELGPPLETVWYVTHRPFRARLAATLEINAPIERVFRTYVDRFPEWQAGLRVRLVRRAPRLTGSEYVTSYDLFGKSIEGRLRLVAADPPNVARYEADGGGVRVWYATSFRSTSSGTRIDVTGDYELPHRVLPRIIDRLFVERSIQREIDAAHQRLRALCDTPD